MPSADGDEKDCALIRHYLSNSYLADLLPPTDNFPFAIKMLAALASRNVSVGRVRLCAETERFSDYRSMDKIFNKITTSDLSLSCLEHHFVNLVKTTDFFRLPTVRGLRQLKLTLVCLDLITSIMCVC